MARGFYWSSNSPYIRGQWVRVRRVDKIDSGPMSTVHRAIPLAGTSMVNANPAHMIYEILTDANWGMGATAASVDTASFNVAAATFFTENFGLFMTWVQSDTIENFLSEILDHVQAFLFLSPLTGLWTLKPLRADYEIDTLPLFTPDNADFTDFQRKLPGETINEMIVQWTNPATEQLETVGQQDLANIVQQGGQIVSQTRNYYGVRSSAVASILAARDLRTACAPLASCKVKAFRSAWASAPADCIRVTIPEEDADELVMRVQAVDYGDGSDKYVYLDVLEDIFALDAPVYTGSTGSAWAGTAVPPNAPDYVKLITVPAFIVANSTDAYSVQPTDPEVNAGLLIADDNPDFLNYEPYTAVTLATGDIQQQSIGTRERLGHWFSTDAIAAADFTDFTGFGDARATLADLVFIGAGGDTATEIALVQAVTAEGVFTLARGVLDTVPRDWPAGTPMWFLDQESIIDPTARVSGETVTYRPLMRTSVGLLPYAEGEDWPITLSDRPYLPSRPANVKVNGTGFGTVSVGTAAATVTWSTRNRLTETSQILGWSTGSVTPEVGQTTTVETLDAMGAVTHTYPGLTGTSTTIPAADLVGAKAIRVYSVRDGSQSLQSYMLMLTA